MSSKTLNTIAKNLRKYRAAQNFTQKDLSEKAGISKTTIIMLEAGRSDTSVGVLLKLSEALGTTVKKLFSEN